MIACQTIRKHPFTLDTNVNKEPYIDIEFHPINYEKY